MYWDKQKRPYVSVTRVIDDVLAKKALRYWFGQQVYRAFAADPTLGEKEALMAPYRAGKAAQERGSTVHSIIETWKQSYKQIETIPEAFKGYAKAFYSFVDKYKMTVVEHEKSVFSVKYGYAGTLDILSQMADGKIFVIDVKTSKGGAIYDESFLQVSAYIQALREEGVKVDGGMVVALSETGIFTSKEVEYCFDEFLACKKLWEWKNKDLLEQYKLYVK